MGQPTSQKIAQWAIESLQSEGWGSLSESCINGLKTHIPSYSDANIAEIVENDLDNIASILRNDAAYATEHGEVVTYEIDQEEPPFIKKVSDALPVGLKSIRAMDDTKFEILCSTLLKSLGWTETERTGGVDDGGVDFYAFGYPKLEIFNLPMPSNCKVMVLGQAKRHKEGNNISETELRKFIGGAVKKLDEFRKAGKVGVLTPVIYAFWTSSDFDGPAKKYAQIMGIWFMNGRTMIEYLKKQNMEID